MTLLRRWKCLDAVVLIDAGDHDGMSASRLIHCTCRSWRSRVRGQDCVRLEGGAVSPKHDSMYNRRACKIGSAFSIDPFTTFAPGVLLHSHVLFKSSLPDVNNNRNNS